MGRAKRYAEKTRVSIASSKTEIEKTLSRYDADSFAYGWEAGRASVGFELKGKYIRFHLNLPAKTEERFVKTPTGLDRTEVQVKKQWEQACRSSWRALCLVIQAKLEAVEAGITTLEEEFLAHIMLPNGQTVGQEFIPQIEDVYQSGGKGMPKLLPFGGK